MARVLRGNIMLLSYKLHELSTASVVFTVTTGQGCCIACLTAMHLTHHRWRY
uniref:Uncharacterized protein n=1 Tax=Anguilla anguilla TaxID=7936 RepID=A0A0E9WC15_ANGAN